MKEKAAFRRSLPERARRLRLLVSRQPALLAAGNAALALGGGFVLAGAPLLDRPLPLALALAAALPFGIPAVCAYLGAAAGYALFWGLDAALEPVAAGFLILAGGCLFRDLLPAQRRWFIPACAAGLYTLVCLIGLMKTRFAPAECAVFAAGVLLLAAACRQFGAALREKSRAGRAVLAVCLLAGASSVPLYGGLPLSAVLASGAVFLALAEPSAIACAAVCGLTLDLTWRCETSMTALFCFAALLVPRVRTPSRALRAALFLVCATAGVLWAGGAQSAFPLAVMAGEALALLLPRGALSRLLPETDGGAGARQTALTGAAELLSGMGRTLAQAGAQAPAPPSAAVFDSAAEKICRSCGSWSLCWERCAAETYRALSGAAGRIFARGEALEEDLPEDFLARCCHIGGFLTAVNEELDNQLARRQYQSRLHETLAVAADQYSFLARLLERLAQEPDAAPTVKPAYLPDFGCRARGVRGSTVSGDRGSCFTAGEWYYVLLCDGMGTGPGAGEESAAAVSLLTGLIRTGFDAQDALQMLNGLDVLAGFGFATVDLLQVSLVTGEGYLHKWGAAPSYLRTARRTQKLGSAAPPPGLGAARRPECIRLSLADGELLALMTDGAAGPEAERFIRTYTGLSPRELAAGIVASAKEGAPDDRTAAALCLRPVGR